MSMETSNKLVEVKALRVEDREGRTVLRDVSFSLVNGGRLAIVGESGAGRTTLALSMLGHLRPGLRHTAGSVRVAALDVLGSSPRVLRQHRRAEISYLGQNPAAALTGSMRLKKQISELMTGSRGEDELRARSESVGLPETGNSSTAIRTKYQGASFSV